MPRRSRRAVIAAVLVALGLQGSTNPTRPPGFFGAFSWSMADNRFGGFSAIEVAPDGLWFTAVSDKGAFVRGRFRRGADDRISGISAGPITLLKDPVPVQLVDARNDSEGMAIAPDGSVYVSFEGPARVLRYPGLEGMPKDLPIPRAFLAYPRNAGFEALALDSNGVLYAIPEQLRGFLRPRLLTGRASNSGGDDFPVWRFVDGKWSQAFTLPRQGGFLPVAADFGPDGRLYVLERTFHGIAGFGSRVRSFQVGRTALDQPRTHLQSPVGMHDNLEGLSVWRDADGVIRLTMISDSNFLPVQRTEIVEYRFGG
ncbi:MAG: esterase-like activity of phytase family protein [Rhodobacteraceae bacterium]|nr:esterase-like activity of phytase family protein [Paracoccaceae bacterium]